MRPSLRWLDSFGSESAAAPVHRHRPPRVQRLLRRLHQDGQAAVGHLSLLHRAHQLRGGKVKGQRGSTRSEVEKERQLPES